MLPSQAQQVSWLGIILYWDLIIGQAAGKWMSWGAVHIPSCRNRGAYWGFLQEGAEESQKADA